MVDRGSYDDYEVAASADALQRYYQQEGYFFARVDWRRDRLSGDEERVTFVVDEGPELEVRGIEFVGQRRRCPTSKLAEVVTVRTVPAPGLHRPRQRRLRHGPASWSRTPSASSSTTARTASPRRTAHAEAATSPDALGAAGRGRGGRRDRRRATRASSTCASPSTRGRA